MSRLPLTFARFGVFSLDLTQGCPSQTERLTPVAAPFTNTTVAAAIAAGRKGVYVDVSDTHTKGLMLRIKPSGARWCVRGTLRGVQVRYELGHATGNKIDDGPAACLETARRRCMEIRAKLAQDMDPAKIIAWMLRGPEGIKEDEEIERKRVAQEAERLRLVAEAEADAIEAATPRTWNWEEAKAAFWIEKERANRDGTLRDYKIKLNVPEFTQRFTGRLVSDITDVEIAEAYAEIFARAEPMADGCLRTIKAFWSFLSAAHRRSLTGVSADLRTVRFEDRTREEEGDPNKPFNPDDEVGDAPEPIQLGIALAIARCPGSLEPHESNALLLLLASCQRRRAVMGATSDRFKRYVGSPDEQAWFVPPFFRKTRTKRGSRSHLVPVLGFGAEAVRAQERTINGSTWLFHNGRKGDQHRNVNMLNKLLESLPGVDWSPHAPRYALSDFVSTLQGFEKSDAKIILDHSEGTEPSDVTATYYTSNPQIAKKREIMSAWMEHLLNLEREAVRANPLLRDAAWIRREVFMARNGDDRTKKREADRTAKGLPMW
ncbi:integrase family protein [Tardiphaga sp. vice154]|uniref:integrase family protein n=1 Tax=Tardiphaga sp. vice154 TaxID=2592814 RepID=UPI001161D7F3|nr:integrase family protein [Tardiphaga sp. vice154]QDM22748.1 integrase family protein [Tardiphaga sp. vice154]